MTDQTHSLQLALAFHEELQLEKLLCLQLTSQTLYLIISVANTPTHSCPVVCVCVESVLSLCPLWP